MAKGPRLVVSCSEEYRQELNQLAEHCGVTVADIVREALRRYVGELEQSSPWEQSFVAPRGERPFRSRHRRTVIDRG